MYRYVPRLIAVKTSERSAIVMELDRLMLKAEQLAIAGDYGPAAERINREILERNPDSVPAMTRLAKWFVKHQSPGDAIALYERALELDSSNRIARNALIDLLPNKPTRLKATTRAKRSAVSGNPAVVIPVQDYYLKAMVDHADELTTLNFGWHRGEAPKKLVAPEGLCRQLGALPFLFRASHQVDDGDNESLGEATHAGLAGIIVHGDSSQYAKLAQFLYETRVERFADYKRADELGVEIGTFYIVAAPYRLPKPIRYEEIDLLSKARKLNPRFRRGYAIVGLPAQLRDWHDAAVATWNRLSKSAGLEAVRGRDGVIAEWTCAVDDRTREQTRQ
jgi:hypothetical protein